MLDSHKYRKNDTYLEWVSKTTKSKTSIDWAGQKAIFSRYAKFARSLMERIHHCNS